MSAVVPLLDRDQIDRPPARARDVVEYRKTTFFFASEEPGTETG